MSVLLTLDLYPLSAMAGTPSLQRYVRGALDVVGASTGSAIGGVVDGTYPSRWTFDMTGLTGDWWCVLSNVNYGGNAPPFPVRVTSTAALAASAWLILDASIGAAAVIPSAISGLCNVLVAVSDAGGDALENCTVQASLEEAVNNMTDGLLISRAVESGTTDSSGHATLTLIQYASFTAGGTYRLVVTSSTGKQLHNRLVRVPTSSSCNAEDLTAV